MSQSKQLSSNSIQKQTLNKDNRLASIKLVDDLKSQKQMMKKYHCTFDKLKKNATNLFNENVYSDDHFKLEQIKISGTSGKKISVSRLKDIVKPGTPLFGEEISPRNKQKSQRLPHWPSWVAEMHILPFWHYETLIQPKYVNQVGFYHVVVWKDGRLIKETIDDTFYYDQISQKLYNKDIPVNNFKLFIWMHILIKTWAKLKGGYDKLQNDDPFDFIRTFSYPDWKAINPVLEDIEQMISYFNPIEKKEVIAVAQTKNDPNVGVFGLLPNSASYIIVGHYMQFEAIFVKIRSLTGAKWNKLKSSEFSAEPEEQISLQPDQFILPIKQFINLFHLVHFTSNKFFPQPQNIHYTRYSLNLDARETKAKMLLLEVNSPSNFTQSTMQKTQKQQQFMTNVTIYFPEVRAYDLGNKKKSQSQEMRQKLVIPWCKLMIGRQQETTNLQASFVQSMKQKMLQNQDGDFLYGKAAIQYQWIEGTYFKGYDTACCFLMRLKPGRYYLRFKIETLRVQYRSNINIVSATHVKISDPKLDKQEQQQFLRQMLSSKARLEKRNIGYLNPIKKGSWFICNDDFQSIGYGYLVIQTTKTSEYKIQLKVDPKKLKESGYRTKSKKDQNKYTLILEDGEGFVLVLKVQDGFQNKNLRVWPPEGIQITRLWRK